MPVFEVEWLADVTGGVWTRQPATVISGVSTDTRTLPPGSLYVALRGERFDGHGFLEHAFKAGATGALVERDGTVEAPAWPLLRVANTRAALLALAGAHRRRLQPLVVGVTGSVGKSTVKEMTAAVFGAAGETARTQGNWNNEVGLPLSLLAMEPAARYGIFEIGMNHPGEIAALCRVLQPDWGIVTAIAPVHLEYFESMEAIAREKGCLLNALPAAGKALLCVDDPYFQLLASLSTAEVKTLSLNGTAADLRVHFAGAARRLVVHERASGERFQFEWGWPGRHNAFNAGFAVLAGRCAGLDWPIIGEGLAGYRPLPMRWEETRINGMLLINDAYNANPTSMRAAAETFAAFHIMGGKWLVLGDMLELGPTAGAMHEELGAALAGIYDWTGIVTVGPLGAHIGKGAERGGFRAEGIWQCEDTRATMQVLKANMRSGDAALFKASRGMTLEQVIAGMGNAQEAL